MILKNTDEYTFVSGDGKGSAVRPFDVGDSIKSETSRGACYLLKNNAEDRYEVWRASEHGFGDIIWCRWKRPVRLFFDHVASESEVEEFHTF